MDTQNVKTNLRRKRRLAFQEADKTKAGLRTNLNFPRPMSLNVMETFLSDINNVVDINYFGTKIFDVYEQFVEDNKAYPNQIEKIQNFISRDIIPSYQNMKELAQYINGKETCECFLEEVNRYIDYDRIIDNDEKINRRFNVDRYLSNNITQPVENLVNSLCEFLDTYNMSIESKFNLCLESIPYSLYKNGVKVKKDIVYEYVTDYFLTKDTIMTDTYVRKMRKVLERYDVNPDGLNKYLMEGDVKYGNIVNQTLEADITSINSEKKLSDFIIIRLDSVNEMISMMTTDGSWKTEDPRNKNMMEFVNSSIDGILAIPLALNVPKTFIESQLVNYASTTKNPYTEEFIMDELDKQYHKSDGFSFLNLITKFKYQTSEDEDPSCRSIFENGELDNDDIRNLFKQFKAEQNKDLPAFKRLMNKLYAKKPEEIVDEMPHIFGIVRSVFILAPVGVPLVGPILSVLVACIDKLISIDVNVKQTDKLLKYLKTEKENIKEKMDDLDGDKLSKAKEYEKSLDKCIDKVENYKSSFGNASDDDFDLGDDFDFDFESCVNSNGLNIIPINESTSEDLKLEEAFNEFNDYQSCLINILEKKDIMNKIVRNLDKINESIGYISKLAINCPISIEYNEFCEAVKDYHYDPLEIETMDIEHKLEMAKEEKVELGTTRNVIIESYCVDTIETIINEGFKLSDVKLAWKSLKNKIKNLSTKEKSLCQSIDAHASTMLNSMEKAIRSDRREAIIKGSIIPSFSRCIKLSITFTGVSLINPVAGLISAMGYFACSKMLNRREKQLIYDEIETELKVVEKQLQLAENDGDMNQYRFLLNYQKKLARERQRIKYNLKVNGRPMPSAVPLHNND